MAEFSADQIWNNLLKEIARQAYVAGVARGADEGQYSYNTFPPNDRPDFEEWWAAFVEQNHTDG